MRSRKLIIAVLCICGTVVTAHAQRKSYVRIKSKPLVRFDFTCAKPSLFQKAKIEKQVRSVINSRGYESQAGVFGDRAFAYDLNGDKAEEYFVPLDCGATGNCTWGIFTVHPLRFLGTIFAENIYIHMREGRLSQLTASEHENVSVSIINTYRFQNSRYRKFGKAYETSAYREDFPRLLLTVEPLCNPHYIPGSIKP